MVMEYDLIWFICGFGGRMVVKRMIGGMEQNGVSSRLLGSCDFGRT